MKRLYFLLIILFAFNQLSAQNDLEVVTFLSPEPSFNYEKNSIVDIEIRIKNHGPNILTVGDSLFISLKIANNDSTFVIKYSKLLTKSLNVDDTYNVLLEKDYMFNIENEYSICAGIDGTKAYPTNTYFQKSPTCTAFVVGVNEVKAKVQKLYYTAGKVNFEFNRKVDAVVHIHDISGKEIYNKRIAKKAGQLDFAVPASGFYFLRLVESNGNTTTSKFIVSNK